MPHRDLLDAAIAALLSSRDERGHWEGHLSSSALSTATAIVALALHAHDAGSADDDDAVRVRAGTAWLMDNQNADGGWGDTIRSASNISTTLLAWAALAFADPSDARTRSSVRDAEAWISAAAGGLDGPRLAAAISARYGRDRTFSVPILTTCVLAGRLGGAEAWAVVPALPFELAAAPRALFAWLRLPVVSYALPALIAMGLARHRRRPSANPIASHLRNRVTPRVLRILETLQPCNGGFLEATPLTSFVALSLTAAGEGRHPVVSRALRFIRASVRPDGSWPVDTHLATWVTTLAVNALDAGGELARLDERAQRALGRWITGQQHTREHLYTGATPGGWAWTPHPGGVPDADDTAGAVLALSVLPADPETTRAAVGGIEWLLSLQNRDGGIPTFCRGWGALPFDRSGADLTAHAIRAWDAWIDRVNPPLRARCGDAIDRALGFLRSAQRADGAFLPLWFGNEAAPGEANPTYGTARVLGALAALKARGHPDVEPMAAHAGRWLLACRNADGGWGGDRGVSSSVEETALAIGALAEYSAAAPAADAIREAITAGCTWMAAATAGGDRFAPSPVGLYFAKLWYSEDLYPVLFAVEGIGRAFAAVPRGPAQEPVPGLVRRPERVRRPRQRQHPPEIRRAAED